MSHETDSVSPREQRLHEIVAGFLQAVDAGLTPDRERLLALHPDLADSLRTFFADHDRMKQAAAPLPPTEAPTVAPSEMPSSAASLGTVRYFGDYELLEEIARGGMGVVYKARQVSLNRTVALKMILSGQFASTSDIERFHREAENAANLDHPNIVPIHEVGEHQGQHYFSMKLIDGGNLAQQVSRYREDPRLAAQLLATVAHTVHFAHQRGILHRDLKPANILLDAKGEPHVTDFGLAKPVEGGGNLTQSGAIVGTPSYMAPEQARAEKGLSTAVDTYSLGVILYELIAGRPPFGRETALDTILDVLEKEPDHPRNINPRADRDLSAIALKCLQKAPQDRYESAAALAEDLDRWLSGEPTRARAPSLFRQAWRWLRRNAAAAAGVIALGVAAGLIAVLTLFATTNDNTNVFLYPPNMGPLNPVRWVQLVRQDSRFRFGVLAIAALLAVGNGWLIRLAARPRSERIALAAAAATGLIATLLALSFLAPTFALKAYRLHSLRLHPVSDPLDWLDLVDRGQGEPGVSQEEARYLAQFPPQEVVPGYDLSLQEMHRLAVFTNRFYQAVVGGWVMGVVVLVFFLVLVLESTWAADHLLRSGRGPVACALCYLELYPPAVALLIWCLIVFVILLVMRQQTVIGGPSWWQLLTPCVLGTALVTLAHVGVIRRWHPAARAGIYLAFLGVGGLNTLWATGVVPW